MYYNMTNLTVSNPVEFFQWINVLTGHLFGPGVAAAFFLIVFIAMKNYPTEKAFLSASFLTSVFSFFLLILDLVDVQVVMIPTVAMVVGLFFLNRSQGRL